MAPIDIQLERINAAINAIGNLQFSVETVNDPELGFKMAGYKDASGVAYKWLVKDKPIKVESVVVTDFGTPGYVKNDGSGNLLGGQGISGSDIPDHNDLDGKQGGEAGQYYHINLAKYNQVTKITGGLGNKQIMYGNSTGFIGGTGVFTWDEVNWRMSLGVNERATKSGANQGWIQLFDTLKAKNIGVFNSTLITTENCYLNMSSQWIRTTAASSTRIEQHDAGYDFYIDNYQSEAADTQITDWQNPFIVRVSASGLPRIGIGIVPHSDWRDAAGGSVLQMVSGSAGGIYGLYVVGGEFGLAGNFIYKDDAKYYRGYAGFANRIQTIANSISFDVANTGLAGTEITWSEVDTNKWYLSQNSSIGSSFNWNQGDFDFNIASLGKPFAFKVNGLLGNIGMGVQPTELWHSTFVALTMGSDAGDPYKNSFYSRNNAFDIGLVNQSAYYDQTDARWEVLYSGVKPLQFEMTSSEFWFRTGRATSTGAGDPVNFLPTFHIGGNSGLVESYLYNTTVTGNRLLFIHKRQNTSGVDQIGVADDDIFAIEGYAHNNNATPEDILYGKFLLECKSPVDDSESGKYSIFLMDDGTLKEQMRLEQSDMYLKNDRVDTTGYEIFIRKSRNGGDIGAETDVIGSIIWEGRQSSAWVQFGMIRVLDASGSSPDLQIYVGTTLVIDLIPTKMTVTQHMSLNGGKNITLIGAGALFAGIGSGESERNATDPIARWDVNTGELYGETPS